MKKTLCLLLALTLSVFTSALAQAPGSKLRVGVITSLSGPNQSEGIDIKNAAELAASEPPTSNTVELIFQDDQSSPAQAIGAFTKLTTTNPVDIVVTVGTPAARALAPLAERKQIPLFAITPLAEVNNGTKYITRQSIDSDMETDVIRAELIRREKNRVFVVSTNVEDNVNRVKDFRRKAASLIRAESVLPGSTREFQSTIAEIKSKNSDSVVLILEPGQFALFAKQAKVENLSIPVFGFSTMESLEDLSSAAAEMEGYSYAGQNPGELFIAKFSKRFFKLPVGASANVYDIIKIIGSGGDQFGKNIDQLLDYFHSLKNFGGSLDAYNSRGSYIPVRPFLKEIRNGQFQLFLNEEGKSVTAPTPDVAQQLAVAQNALANSSAGSTLKTILISVIIALVLAMIGGGVWSYASSRDESKVQDMVQGLLSASGISERLTKSRMMSDQDLDILKKTSRKQKQGQIQTALFGEQATTSLSDKLFRAGYFTKEERERHERRQLMFPLVGLFVGLILAVAVGGKMMFIIIAPILGFAIGWQLPDSLLNKAIQKRQDEVLYYLPLVIEQISIGVSSSLDIWPCISNILDMAKARNTLNPVTELFLYVEKLVGSGLQLQEALDEVAVACGISQVQMAFKFLGQCAEHGGEVSKQLQDLANAVMRERQTQIEGKIAALPVKATGPLFLVFAGFFILMLAGIFTRLLSSLSQMEL